MKNEKEIIEEIIENKKTINDCLKNSVENAEKENYYRVWQNCQVVLQLMNNIQYATSLIREGKNNEEIIEMYKKYGVDL